MLLKHPIDFYGETQVKAKLCDQGMISLTEGIEFANTLEFYSREIASPQLLAHMDAYEKLSGQEKTKRQKICYTQKDDIWALGCLICELFPLKRSD